jgi:serine O-acetyltransferase
MQGNMTEDLIVPKSRYPSRMGFFALVRADFGSKAEWVYGSRSSRNVLKAFAADGSFAMITYRLMQASQRLHLAPFAMMFNKLNVLFGNCVIGRNADFGPGFVLIHSLGVVINGAVRGGSDVRIEHQVTIGAERNESPVLGSDLFVGAGAKILGPVKVGSNVRIGANAVVLSDLPDGVTAVGIPAKVVRQR